MKNNSITFLRILAIGFILLCASVAWFVLAGSLQLRTNDKRGVLDQGVANGWGPAIKQTPPTIWVAAPVGEAAKHLQPASSEISVNLQYQALRKGLFWYRTFEVAFEAEYEVFNPAPIEQLIYVNFSLPSDRATYFDLRFEIDGKLSTGAEPRQGVLSEAVMVPAGGRKKLHVAYRTRGVDRWEYALQGENKMQDFRLEMVTDFAEVNYPAASPTTREANSQGGWNLEWRYSDVVGAQSIAMDMPNVLNAGPVAMRISFFAPVSLVFFFAVLLILGTVIGVGLHPMNYFFLAAGCFAFQLLFAYLVDVWPIHLSFGFSAFVSMLLVSGYLHAVGGWKLSSISVPAQFAFMVLFSYSFFFDGFTGLTVTVGAVVTLAILMITTAKVDWSTKFVRKPRGVIIPNKPAGS